MMNREVLEELWWELFSWCWIAKWSNCAVCLVEVVQDKYWRDARGFVCQVVGGNGGVSVVVWGRGMGML